MQFSTVKANGKVSISMLFTNDAIQAIIHSASINCNMANGWPKGKVVSYLKAYADLLSGDLSFIQCFG